MKVSSLRRLPRLRSWRYSITAPGWIVARSIRCSSSSTKVCCLWLETGDFFVRTGAASNTQCAPIVASCVESVRLLQPSPAAYSYLPARTVFPPGNKVLHCLHTETERHYRIRLRQRTSRIVASVASWSVGVASIPTSSSRFSVTRSHWSASARSSPTALAPGLGSRRRDCASSQLHRRRSVRRTLRPAAHVTCDQCSVLSGCVV
jgi:hypothetical protein